MKNIALVVLSVSSLHAMDHNQNQTKPATQKKEAHEQPHIQAQVNMLQDLMLKRDFAWQQTVYAMACKQATLEHLYLEQEQRNQQNIVNIMSTFNQHREQTNAQNNALVERIHMLETIVRAIGTDLQYVLKSRHEVAAAHQSGACAQPQSFQPQKLTITVSGPDDQTIALLK